MKSNLPGTFNPPVTGTATAPASSARSGSSAGAGLWGDWQSEPTGPGQQAFNRWLSQYRTAQVMGEPGAQGSPGARPAEVPAGKEAWRGAGPLAGTAPAARAPGMVPRAAPAVVNRPPGLVQEAAPGAPAAAQGRPTSRPAPMTAPPARPNPAGPDRAAPPGRETDRSAEAGPAEGTAAPENTDDAPQPVEFETDRGLATAWVQELNPPEGLPLGDPAAVMAWLAALPSPEVPLDPTGLERLPSALDDAQALPSTGPSVWLDRSGAAALQAHELMASMEGLSARGGADTATLVASQRGVTEAAAMSMVGMTATPEALRNSLKTASEPMRHFTGNLSTPLDNPAFPQALAERVGMWVSGPAQHGPMTAELRLNPQELGPVHVRIELDGQNAQVDFAAAHAGTRQAIEQSLPLLSRALEEAGLSLAGSGVSDQGGRQAWQDQARGPFAPDPARADEALGGRMSSIELPAGVHRMGNAQGGLDLYA